MDKSGLKPIINLIARKLAKQNISYSQSQYIFKQVRKKLELKPEKKNKGTVKRLSRKEYKRFINMAYEKSSKIGLMMQVLFETATRVDEFTSFNADDIYFEELRIVIQSGKGDKRREVPIEENLARLLSTHLKDRRSGPIFRTQRNGRFTNRRIQQIVKEIAEIAQITSIEVTPHTLRHSRATFLAEDGMGKDYLQVFLGHDQPTTTEIYTKTAAMDTDKEFRRIMSENRS
ncbi:tyrosine-type recombinase/integrase [Aureispira anguillae]|uniref:Tyrosine-type recombinase/integrase n=1 Tax=Aureispira anguillae TaxID=2864201 RepID=A0A916DWQ1_9BACT|nr:tyrosine-type recombinase/integrase [Aureispira anguillae]BDS15696.1 tyrosine-type recombinase/integrase [Aureispira anguillae]